MDIPAILRHSIIEFLTNIPNIHDHHGQQAFLDSAGLDTALYNQLHVGEPPKQFVELIVSTLLRYGKLQNGQEALEAVLEAAKQRVGTDKQVLCDQLLHNTQTLSLNETSDSGLYSAIDSDIDILQQHRKIFDRPAFRLSCINELHLKELSEATDDIQAALNTGSLYSRSGKILSTFPTKDDYTGQDFRQAFTGIMEALTQLKFLIVSIEAIIQRAIPKYTINSHYFPYFYTILKELIHTANKTTIHEIIAHMDKIDMTRNEILSHLNKLFLKYTSEYNRLGYSLDESPRFRKIEISSSFIQEGRLSEIGSELAKYL